MQEAQDLSRNFRNSLYDDIPWIEGPVNTASPGATIPIAKGSVFVDLDSTLILDGHPLIDFKTRVPRPEVEYIDPEVYSAVGFRVVCNPGNIHCITASSPELAQRVAELLNRDGWNAKKAKLQTTTLSGEDSD